MTKTKVKLIFERETLNNFNTWVTPTNKAVSSLYEALGVDDGILASMLGVDERTIRRWALKSGDTLENKSSINYGAWCILVATYNNKIIFGKQKNNLKAIIDPIYVCSFDCYKSPPRELLLKFVGRDSFTGLNRKELSLLFGWNSAYLGKTINDGNIKYLNWVLLLLFLGYNVVELCIKNNKLYKKKIGNLK